MGRRVAGLRPAIWILALTSWIAGCAQPPAHQYPITGQIIAVNSAKQEITIKHEDIPGLMPAMTMSYAVTSPSLLVGRAPGELITGTLEVRDALGKLSSITHTGQAPLPADSNEAALAAGLLNPGDALPDAALIDQSNRRRSLSEWKGTQTVITFIYTRCPLPDFCPLMDQNFATLQRRINQDTALRGRVKLISITMDPDFDTPAVLEKHAGHLHADPAMWTFLTGDRGTIDQLAGKLGVGIMRDTPQTLTHNLRTTVLDADLRIVKIFSGNDWTPGDVLSTLSRQ